MTIAITLEVFLPIINGVITTTINLAENLQAKGHKVLFIVPAWKAFKESEINGIPVYSVPSLPTYMYPGIRLVSPWSRMVEKVLLKEEVDVLQITGPWLLSLAAIKAAKKNNIPVVQVFHTLIYEDSYLYYGMRIRALIPLIRVLMWKYIGMYIKKSDVVTAPSVHACNVLRNRYKEANIKHILNGINVSDFIKYDAFSVLTAKYPEFNAKTFIFVGRLGEEKSVSVLIEAFARVHSEDSDIKLVIVGDGPNRNEYELTVQRQSLEDSIFFLGRIPHEELIHSGLIHYSRAMVTASTTENQPITIIEAIACGTPVIMPDVDGINELLKGNGMLFPAGDAEAFAGKILELAYDDALYNQYREAGCQFRDNFDGAKIAEQFEREYGNVLGLEEKIEVVKNKNMGLIS